MSSLYNRSTDRVIIYSLGSLLTLLAINAFAGGYYGMAGAKNVPLEWLKDSPFHSYFIPGIILFIVVGGSSLTAAIAVFKRTSIARNAAFFAGIITFIWLSVQVLIIGYVSWMQPTTAIAVFLILFLTWHLPKNEHKTFITLAPHDSDCICKCIPKRTSAYKTFQ